MKVCSSCEKELYDFDEVKYGLCWDCLAKKEEVAENDPNLGEIRDDELASKENFSIVIHDDSGTKLTLGAKKKAAKSKLSDDKAEAKTKKDKPTTVTKKDDEATPANNEEEPEDIDELEQESPKEKEPPKATTEKGGIKKPIIEDEEEMKVVRESREVITNSSRAKLRALAIINQAVKETGDFDVVAIVEGKRLSVTSKPINAKNPENVLMTTTMDALDFESASDQKTKKK